jgi:hypothetical protein
MHRKRASIVALALVLFAGERRNVHAASPGLLFRSVEPDACSLLTAAEVSKALEEKSLPGKRVIPQSPKMCSWSDDADQRSVVVSYSGVAGFAFAKSPKRNITIEPAPGIGDDAFYLISNSKTSPFLHVRKGNSAFSIRVLNGLKLKPFTQDQEKTKEADLAKAAVARL